MSDAGDSSDNSAEASDSANLKGDENSAPPLDAAAWRQLFKTIAPRDLWGVLQKDKPAQAQIFAGFRPAPEMLRTHPVVVKRLAETAIKQPAFAKAVRELLPESDKTAESGEAETAAAQPVTETSPVSLPAAALPLAPLPVASAAIKKVAVDKSDDKSREKINALRDAARQQTARIAELQAALTQAEGERDAARKETVTQSAALRDAQESLRRAEAEVRREKRIRERDLQKAEADTQAKVEKAAQKAKSVVEAVPVSAIAAPSETLLYAAAQRFLQVGRAQTVADLCKQALLVDAPNAGQTERGRVHSLFAQALYGMGDGSNGAAQDRFAIAAFLDGGQAALAAEALARLAERSPSGFRVSDAPFLKRAAALAQKTNQTEAVRTVFKRLRVTAPGAYLTLRPALGSGAASQAVLTVLLGEGASGSRAALGPDEPVTLPHTPGYNLAVITPRRLVRAVHSGDAQTVSAVRAALHVLRGQDDKASVQLADAFLDAVVQIAPIAASPLLHENTRPIIVDASNVARYNADPLSLQTAPRVLHLKLMRDYLLRRGYFPVSLIADANLRYHVDDKAAYLELIENHIVRETPPGTSADEVLLQEARAQNVPLVTNDRFSDWGEAARQVERLGFLVSASGATLTSF